MITRFFLQGLLICSTMFLQQLDAQEKSAALLSKIDADWENHKADAMTHQHEALGWCTQEKATKMMELIYDTHPLVCVEVGVFGGSSIYPTAKALEYLGRGTIYAIDPWTKEDCQVGYDPTDVNYLWWSSLDLEAIYQGFLCLIENHCLTNFCVPMKMTSAEAVGIFEDSSIDILHIDGNHTEESAFKDVQMWFPKVKKGGYIWFDDVNWASTGKAVSYLKAHCEVDVIRSVGNECLLFRKTN